MTDKTNWQASLLEQRTAWGVTFCAMIIAMLAASQPQWFEFSFSTDKAIHKQAPVTKVVEPSHNGNTTTNSHADQAAALKTATVKTAPIKAASPKTASVKPVKIKPITQSTPVTTAKAKPALNKTITASKKKTTLTHGFYVQLGAFAEKSRAHGLADQLKRKGWSVKITDKKNGLHAVWIGPKSTKADAEKLLKTIRSKLKQKGFIVQHNNG